MLDGLELSLATSGEVSPEISFVQFKLDKDAILAFDKSRGDIVNLLRKPACIPKVRC